MKIVKMSKASARAEGREELIVYSVEVNNMGSGIALDPSLCPPKIGKVWVTNMGKAPHPEMMDSLKNSGGCKCTCWALCLFLMILVMGSLAVYLLLAYLEVVPDYIPYGKPKKVEITTIHY